jgi:putative protease
MTPIPKPEILAPAGDPASFLAALAAGADAVYCGLKHFSARMLARNFSVAELGRLAELARKKGRRTYVALNVMVKPDEMDKAGRMVRRLVDQVGPEGLILQDLGMAKIARLAGFAGEMHLSTLANASHPLGLGVAAQLGFSRVVVPRELSVDEIRAMAEACGPGMALEVFVHGALCHNVSGRAGGAAFWAARADFAAGACSPAGACTSTGVSRGAFFSCLDLSLDVLARTLLRSRTSRPGRSRAARRVPTTSFTPWPPTGFCATSPTIRRPRRPPWITWNRPWAGPAPTRIPAPAAQKPVDHRDRTGSGLAAGKLSRSEQGGFQLATRIPLLAGDLLRVGFEDAAGHQIIRISRSVPKGGRYSLRFEPGQRPDSGTPVFLIDRRAPELARILENMEPNWPPSRRKRPPRSSSPSAPPSPTVRPAGSRPLPKASGGTRT